MPRPRAGQGDADRRAVRHQPGDGRVLRRPRGPARAQQYPPVGVRRRLHPRLRAPRPPRQRGRRPRRRRGAAPPRAHPRPGGGRPLRRGPARHRARIPGPAARRGGGGGPDPQGRRLHDGAERGGGGLVGRAQRARTLLLARGLAGPRHPRQHRLHRAGRPTDGGDGARLGPGRGTPRPVPRPRRRRPPRGVSSRVPRRPGRTGGAGDDRRGAPAHRRHRRGAGERPRGQRDGVVPRPRQSRRALLRGEARDGPPRRLHRILATAAFPHFSKQAAGGGSRS